MTRDPWLRLAFIVSWMALVFGLVMLAFWAGWAVSVAVSAGGLLLATIAAEDWSEWARPEGEKPEPIVSGRAQRRALLRSGAEANGE